MSRSTEGGNITSDQMTGRSISELYSGLLPTAIGSAKAEDWLSGLLLNNDYDAIRTQPPLANGEIQTTLPPYKHYTRNAAASNSSVANGDLIVKRVSHSICSAFNTV